MFCPCVMQMLALAVVFLTVRSSSLPCFDETQLEDRARKKLRHFHEQPSDTQLQPTPPHCPVGLYAHMAKHTDNFNDRSISPWRIVYDTNKDRFPHTIAKAECLCEGCITISKDRTLTESPTYNSVAIAQSVMVLKKKRCADGNKYKLEPSMETVPVGCTCVKPRT